MAKITKDMTIASIFKNFPDKAQFLANELEKVGLTCGGCSAATWETLEGGMLGHGMSPESIDKLIAVLNEVLDKEFDTDTITLTKKAAEKFKEILESENQVGYGLRVSEKAGGCGGSQYVLDFSKKSLSDDLVFTSEGIEIHVNKNFERLKGIVIDYVEGLNGAGFKISNPNARSSCGCGNSHSY